MKRIKRTTKPSGRVTPKDDFEYCPRCNNPMTPVYENVGFVENPHYQIEGWRCPDCKIRIAEI